MTRPRPRRRLALVAGLAAGLGVAALPSAQASLLDTTTEAIEEAFAPQLVTVTADLAQRNVLANSGLDVTEHAGHDYVEVVLHTVDDLALLESLGLPFEVRIPDLGLRSAQIRAANEAYAEATDASPLPSGRDSYRTLEDYNAEMRALAEDHPGVVKLLELPHQTVEGKTVLGLEIATGVNETDAADDERPTFVLMGLHHAREWPSGEHTMEFAHDLVQGYERGDARIAPLVERARTLLIPVVNADGFEKSITDGMLVDLRALNDTGLDPLDGQTSILVTPGNAYKRKNCRPHDGMDTAPGFCDAAKSPGGFGIGVDLNRNYGAFHGGPGAAAEPVDPTYHGPEGFSEPEIQNVRELVSTRHVTMLISNHTFSNLVLRPNGVNPQTIGPDGNPVGDAPDEDAMKALGASFAAQNGYRNIHGWELYDTTGTTEDWSYNATGGYGYTFEIGPDEFHPPFPEVVDEYLGAGEYAGKGNREAYLIALEAAIDPTTHSIVAGDATPGATLRLTRTGSTPTWTGSFTDTVDTVLRVPADGRFEWHTNPSTRPLAMSKRFQVLAEEPTEEEVFTGTVPAPAEHVDVEWQVDQPATIANVALDWSLPDDLDLEVYRKEADGSLTQVGSSGSFVGEKELATFMDPQPGTYVLRVINFAAVPGQPFTLTATTHLADTETTTGLIEAWTLTCEVDGEVVEQVPVIVDRGQRVLVDLEVCGPKGPPKKAKPAGAKR
ncbi:MAG TPA: M14 family zinc carboxypeptidase [Acidimicrobiales bacterium]|nr:M14 family zinc carboxypeptidase [Acidimicrobiales bacterium]